MEWGSLSAGAEGTIIEGLLNYSTMVLILSSPPYSQHLYDADVVSEDAVLSWAGSGAKSILKTAVGPFRAACQPFIDWLQEAEESEGEEEDDEE